MLYESLFVGEGDAPLPQNVVEKPEVARYVAGWGRDGDVGFIAVEGAIKLRVGAVWVRIVPGGYGFVDAATPELGIAVARACRGRGIGTMLIERALAECRARYAAVSLSVSLGNRAIHLYERLGFRVVRRSGTSMTMRKSLS